MQAVFLTCHLPYPPVSGGRLREFELLRRISREVDLHVVAVSKTYEEDLVAAPALSRLCASVTVLPASGANGSPPAQVHRHRCPRARLHVASLLRTGEIDLVHVEGFYLMQHVPPRAGVPVLLVEQNVEYALWEQRLALAETPRARQLAERELIATRKHELAAWRRATLCAAVTEDDRATMLGAVPDLHVRVAPDGADHLRPASRKPASEPRIVFVGNFSYEPNADGARWFCAEILPRIRAVVPEARVQLVGNSPSPEVLSLASGAVEVTGRVPSVEPYLDEAAVVVAPLRVGGGIKVKVLEALCRGKAVVSTSIGVQGLGGSPVRVADSPTDFAAAVAELLADPGARARLESESADFARRLPTWDDAARALLDCYRAASLDPAVTVEAPAA